MPQSTGNVAANCVPSVPSLKTYDGLDRPSDGSPRALSPIRTRASLYMFHREGCSRGKKCQYSHNSLICEAYKKAKRAEKAAGKADNEEPKKGKRSRKADADDDLPEKMHAPHSCELSFSSTTENRARLRDRRNTHPRASVDLR